MVAKSYLLAPHRRRGHHIRDKAGKRRSITQSGYCLGYRLRKGPSPLVSISSTNNTGWVLIILCIQGPLRIYRALGTVAFLNSGDTLQPILAKSQCWCVDGESKFVLRIRHNFYYRIELPRETAEDKARTETLKGILGKILKYEVTPCPFQRGFTVELPEAPKTPIRQRPWRPQQRPQSPSKGNKLSSVIGKEDDIHAMRASSTMSSDNDRDGEDTIGAGMAPETVLSNSYEDFDILKTPTRPKALRAGRSITAPPHLSLHTTPPSNIEIRRKPSKLAKESTSLSSSVDSFHSFHSPISPLPPSPPLSEPLSSPSSSDSDCGIRVPRSRHHQSDSSELTVTPGTVLPWETTLETTDHQHCEPSSPTLMATPALTNDTGSQSGDLWPEIISPTTPSPSKDIYHRKTPSLRRAGSPLPSSTNLYSPGSRMSGHHLTTAILQRTFSMLLGPPIQLVALMLNIAAKIAKGAMKGASFGFGEVGQKIPCSWDYSDPEDDPDYWEEDDFGVSLSKVGDSKTTRRKGGQSWEID